jgi:PEP-CTERM motif
MNLMKANITVPLHSFIALVALTTLSATASSFAFPLDEGLVLPDYAVVSVGPNASIKVNSGPIKGNVLLGNGTTSSSSGGGNGQVIGRVDVSLPVFGDTLLHIQIPPTIVPVPSSVGVTAFNDAVALSNAASALAPTQTLGNVTGALNITGNGGLNVIDINSLSNPDLTITGGSNDNFVFNISGNFQTNHVMVLNGVTPSQILFNLTGTSGNIFQTSGGDVLFGTFLATHGGNFQFSNLNLTGQLINTAGHMEIVSGSRVTIPEPNTFGLITIGAIGLAWARKRWTRA